MARFLILGVIAVLLLGGFLAADQALQNPELEPADTATDAQQQQFTETVASTVQVAGPIAGFALAAGVALAAVRVLGGVS